MGTLLLILVVVILVAFIFSLVKDKNQVESAGGIKTQYAEFIHLVMEGDLNTRILKQSHKQIIIKAGTNTDVRYNLLWAFSSLTVVYSFNSILTGSHSFELVFRDNLTQEQMYDKLCMRISELANKMGI